MALSPIPEERVGQVIAIELQLATAPDIQDDLKAKFGYGENIFFYNDLIEYRINNSPLDIAEDLDVKSLYGIESDKITAEAVGSAFRGHHNKEFMPKYRLEGLFGKETNDYIKNIRKGIGARATVETHGDQLRNGGLIGGRKVADMINPETGVRYVVEAGRIGGRKGNEAQGNHMWSLEEIAEIGELKYGEGLTWKDTTSKMNEKYDENWATGTVRMAYQNNKDLLPDEEE